jgi:hypothetical protein
MSSITDALDELTNAALALRKALTDAAQEERPAPRTPKPPAKRSAPRQKPGRYAEGIAVALEYVRDIERGIYTVAEVKNLLEHELAANMARRKAVAS